MRKNPHNRIFKGELKKHYLSIVPKSCPYFLCWVVLLTIQNPLLQS